MRSINKATVFLDGWTPDAVGIGPFLGDQTTMPAQHRAGSDQAMPPQHPRQPPDQRGEHRSIRPVQARPRVGSAQHGDFVAQHQEFDVLGCRRAAEQQQQVHKLEEDQVEQTQRHGTIMPRPPSSPTMQLRGTGRLLKPHRLKAHNSMILPVNRRGWPVPAVTTIASGFPTSTARVTRNCSDSSVVEVGNPRAGQGGKRSSWRVVRS